MHLNLIRCRPAIPSHQTLVRDPALCCVCRRKNRSQTRNFEAGAARTSNRTQRRLRPSFFRPTNTLHTRHSATARTNAGHRTVPRHRAFIALGSNVGDRLRLIEDACKALNAQDDTRITRTSSLWETKAMYFLDQSDFLNGVCEIQTSLDPMSLLDRLQSIERQLQRRKTIDKGPRTIDLDILLYEGAAMANERLVIPHKLMLERAFVLQPLCQLIPDEKPPNSEHSYAHFLDCLDPSSLASSTMTPLGGSLPPLRALDSARTTRLMSILNVTPDSFSDGGVHSAGDTFAFEKTIHSHLDAGVSIIDVGGQSTRPNADDVGEEEEVRRTIPAIRAIRSIVDKREFGDRVAISIDTFRAGVARAAIEAGADIVNDVSAGELDRDMLATIAELGCSVMLMHMRGNPSTMSNNAHTSYPDGLIKTVGAELADRIRAAEEAGIHRWRIMLDPGIGFAKKGSQNLELLERFATLRQLDALKGLPWVIGTSRKRFIGQVTGVSTARERVWGTAACVAAAVQGGADVVRVHDVGEMGQVVTMADAIWRRTGGCSRRCSSEPEES